MRLVAAVAFLVLLVPFRAGAVTTTADPERPTLMQIAKDGTRSELPLVRSHLSCSVRGPIAQVTLTQSFHNSSDKAIEAVYVFPMHQGSAVGAMTMTIGTRTIRAVMKTRNEAVATYEQAKADGKAAALLTQERPNVFTQSVANILPGEQIHIELVYDVLLEPDGGEYELALPTVVGPRYIPGEATLLPPSGGGRALDTDQVPDASRITPPIAPPGQSTGNDYGLDLDLDPGFPVVDVTSPTHAIVVTPANGNLIRVALADGATPADKDLVVRWRIVVDKPTVAVLADHTDKAGHLALVLQPPPSSQIDRTPREMVFVMDTSGSMSGEPLALVTRGIRRALQDLRPDDAFRIINFSTDVSGFQEGAVVPATTKNLRDARSWLNGTMAGGGTEMILGVRAALPGKPADGRVRYVVFMTDGFIGNDEEIIQAVKDQRDPMTHLFSFGAGSSVNRYLLDEMAKAGDGVASYMLLDEDPAGQLDDFFARIDTPAMTSIQVDWGGLGIEDPSPAKFGSLFANRPLVIAARYTKSGKATIKIKGKRGDENVTLEVPVVLPAGAGDGAVLGRLWARRRIGELKDEAAITNLALEYSLMSAYTAFVAVDDSRRVDRPGDAIQVPVDLPEGVGLEAISGGYNTSYGSVGSGEVISISGSAPIIDQGSTVQGVTIDTEYTRNIPLPGRTFASALGAAYGSSSYENSYIVEGTSYLGGQELPRWRLSLSADGGYDLEGERAIAGFSSSIERRVGNVLAVGVTGSWWRLDDKSLMSVMATLGRWSLMRIFDLRLGLGVAELDHQAGVSWQIRLAAPLPLGDVFQPELHLGVDGATLDDDQGVLGTSLGIGVRF